MAHGVPIAQAEAPAGAPCEGHVPQLLLRHRRRRLLLLLWLGLLLDIGPHTADGRFSPAASRPALLLGRCSFQWGQQSFCAALSPRARGTREAMACQLGTHLTGSAVLPLAVPPNVEVGDAATGRLQAVQVTVKLIGEGACYRSAYPLRTLSLMDVWFTAPQAREAKSCQLQREAEQLLAMITADIPSYSPSQLADALLAFVRLQAGDVPFARLLQREAAVLRAAVQWLSHPLLVAGLSASDAAWSIWALGRLRCLDETVVEVVGRHLQGTALAALDVNGVSRVLWGLAQGGVADPLLAASLLNHTLDNDLLPTLRGAAISNTVWALATLQHRDVRFMDALTMHLLSSQTVLNSLDGRMVASTLWGFARLNVRHRSLMACLLDRALRKAQPPSTHALAILAWVQATLRVHHRPALQAIASEATKPDVLSALHLQEMAVLVRAFASLRVCDEALMLGMAQEVLRRLGTTSHAAAVPPSEELTPRIVAMLMWAYARVRMRQEEMLLALLHCAWARGLWGQCSVQDVADILWALAMLHLDHQPLLEALSGLVTQDSFLFALNASMVATVTWALARLDTRHPIRHAVVSSVALKLVDRILQMRFLATFNPHELSITAWAFAKLGIRQRQLFIALHEEFCRRGLKDWNPRDITNFVWAFAVVQLHPARLLSAILHLPGTAALAKFKPRELSQVAWSLMKLGAADPRFLASIALQVVGNGTTLVAKCTPVTTATLAWVFTVEQFVSEPFLSAVARHFLDDQQAVTLPPREFSIILWALVYLDVRVEELPLVIRRRVASAAFLERWGPSEVAMVLRSIARLRLADESLLSPVTQRVTQPAFLAQSTGAHLANILAAYSKLPVPSGAVLTAVTPVLQEPRVLESLASLTLHRMWRALARMERTWRTSDPTTASAAALLLQRSVHTMISDDRPGYPWPWAI
eukprot:GGOE01037390.1.p1 GENE.GGOE01037390.1~~GGOE01037390.1.p1  ORF type:complete len:932 (-),score=185.79 GGOE01037390.1:51-2846(-)